jgi:hypothetical protein
VGRLTREWIHMQGDNYIVTGLDRNGKRFKRTCDNWIHADGINVYRGTKWLLRAGKRIKLQEIYN